MFSTFFQPFPSVCIPRHSLLHQLINLQCPKDWRISQYFYRACAATKWRNKELHNSNPIPPPVRPSVRPSSIIRFPIHPTMNSAIDPNVNCRSGPELLQCVREFQNMDTARTLWCQWVTQGQRMSEGLEMSWWKRKMEVKNSVCLDGWAYSDFPARTSVPGWAATLEYWQRDWRRWWDWTLWRVGTLSYRLSRMMVIFYRKTINGRVEFLTLE